MKHCKSVEFCQFLECQATCTNAKSLIENFLVTVLSLLLIHTVFCPQEAQSYRNEAKVYILTCAVTWPAQNFAWVKMFDFRLSTVFCTRYCILKHKMTRYSKNPEGPWPPGYAYIRAVYITYM